MLCVCLTRTSKHKYVEFCDIECVKPYNYYSYIHSYNNISCIGCTTDIEQIREQETIKQLHLVGH